MLAIHNSLPSRQLPSPPHLEVLSVELSFSSPVLISVVYIPPSSNPGYCFDLLHYLDSVAAHPRSVIVGDFNLPDISWSTLTGHSPVSNALCDLVFRHNLLQLVDFPTHSKGNILDLVFVNSENLVSNLVQASSNTLCSDHCIISFNLFSTCSRNTSKVCHSPIYDFKKTDLDGLLSFLLDVDFDPLLNLTDIELIWSNLKDLILYSISLYTPQRHARPHLSPAWMNSSVRHQLNKTRSCRKKCKFNSSSQNVLRLSLAETRLQDEMAAAMASFENNLVSNFAFSNDSKIYHYIRSLSGHVNLPDTMYWDSISAQSDSDKANLLNKFFHSVFTVDIEPATPDSSTIPASSLCSIDISLEDTFLALSSCDPSKAKGGDGIPPLILNQAAAALAKPVHHLFSLCLSKSYLPAEWRCHHVTPIHKSGDRSLVTNYRPISLLCCLSKVLERLVFDKVYDFIVKSFISNSQFGFVTNRSTLHQLLLYSEFLHTAFENRQQVDSIYLDIRKAFDTVSHTKLLSKLWNAGIIGNVWSFFRAYLSNRQQCVVIANNKSEWHAVTSGVPQGSILGPLLFIFFINDLSLIPSFSTPYLFADDTKCCARILSHSDSSCLQEDLDLIYSWSTRSGLTFNISKSCLLSFCNRSVSPVNATYHLGQAEIPLLDHCKDLGVIFSSNLSWSKHYSIISAKAYKQLGLIRLTFSSSVSIRAKKLLYLSLVRSQLTYCCQVWRPHLIKDIIFLERTQRRATKYILNDFSADYKSRLISLNLLPLMFLYELFDVLFFVKCLKFPDPSFDVKDFISFSTSSTRSGSAAKLTHKFSSTSISHHSYFCRLIRIWNSLPPIDLSLSFLSIKQQIKQYFWNIFLSQFDPSLPCSFHVVCPCFKCSHLPVSVTFSS